jgi:hypothetical protein
MVDVTGARWGERATDAWDVCERVGSRQERGANNVMQVRSGGMPEESPR